MNARSNAVSIADDVLVRCGCGAAHTPEDWGSLPIVGWMARLELRNCHCGSTLSLRIESWRELMDKVLHATAEPEGRLVGGEIAFATGYMGALERAAAEGEARACSHRKVPWEQTCSECGHYDLEAGLCRDPFLKDPEPEAATKPACEFFTGRAGR